MAPPSLTPEAVGASPGDSAYWSKETTKFAAYCRNLTEKLNEEREHADALAAALRDVIAALDSPTTERRVQWREP